MQQKKKKLQSIENTMGQVTIASGKKKNKSPPLQKKIGQEG
jgi:hypothetical protein